jgi:hypothetical protein
MNMFCKWDDATGRYFFTTTHISSGTSAYGYMFKIVNDTVTLGTFTSLNTGITNDNAYAYDVCKISADKGAISIFNTGSTAQTSRLLIITTSDLTITLGTIKNLTGGTTNYYTLSYGSSIIYTNGWLFVPLVNLVQTDKTAIVAINVSDYENLTSNIIIGVCESDVNSGYVSVILRGLVTCCTGLIPARGCGYDAYGSVVVGGTTIGKSLSDHEIYMNSFLFTP